MYTIIYFIGYGPCATSVLERRRSVVAEGCSVFRLHRGIIRHTLHFGAKRHIKDGHVKTSGIIRSKGSPFITYYVNQFRLTTYSYCLIYSYYTRICILIIYNVHNILSRKNVKCS